MLLDVFGNWSFVGILSAVFPIIFVIVVLSIAEPVWNFKKENPRALYRHIVLPAGIVVLSASIAFSTVITGVLYTGVCLQRWLDQTYFNPPPVILPTDPGWEFLDKE